HAFVKWPAELLSQMFAFASQDDINAPVVLSHVCSSWRHIAIRSPDLWTHVVFDRRIDMWKERIRRSRNRPLYMQMSSSPNSSRHTFPDFDDAHLCMHTIAPHIHRLRSLAVSYTHRTPYLFNATLSELCAPPTNDNVHARILESLSLIHPANDDNKVFFLFGGVAPRLKDVSLDGVRLAWLPSVFGNLVNLKYTHHGFLTGSDAVHEVLCMLKTSSMLETLTISFSRSSRDVYIAGNHLVSLTRLRRLALQLITNFIPPELVMVALSLEAPNLTDLHLDVRDGVQSDFVQTSAIPNILDHFHHHRRLSHVRAMGGWFHGRSILSLVSTLPCLRHITAMGPHVSDAFLVRLGGAGEEALQRKGQRSRRSVPCPNLSTLDLSLCHSVTIHGVRGLICGRMSSEATLDLVRVRQCAKLYPQAFINYGTSAVDVRRQPDGFDLWPWRC
ncbi:hypothetical protein BD410DRAFT_723378, partial [Rickenella mellea]